jgi:hypothetical protein
VLDQSFANLANVAYGAGGFVAVGREGRIVTSLDGVTWTARISGVTGVLHDVAFGPLR